MDTVTRHSHVMAMNPAAVREIDPPVKRFGSGMDASVSLLTNFAQLPGGFKWRGHTWPSSEHAFQAALRVPFDYWSWFAEGGRCSTLDGLGLVFPLSELQKKTTHYGPTRTGKVAMVGIVAKMAVKQKVAKKIGLPLLSPDESVHSVDEMEELFLDILMAKYRACASARSQLLATAGHHLVEFSRAAERDTKKGKPPLWTGLVSKNDKMLYGHNMQGELQMRIRERLFQDA